MIQTKKKIIRNKFLANKIYRISQIPIVLAYNYV